VLWRRPAHAGGTEFVVSALPLGGYVRWIDDRESGVLPSEQGQTFKSKSLAQRTAIVAAGPLSNLLLAVLLYAAANWIGIEEPKALLATPPMGSLAERAGVRAGELVKATSTDGSEWRDVRSMSDLSWAITQAVMRGEPLQLMVSDAERPQRAQPDAAARCTREPRDRRPDAAPHRALRRLQRTRDRAVTPGGRRPGRRASGRRVVSVDGRPVPTARGLLDLIRASRGAILRHDLARRAGGQPLELTVSPRSRTARRSAASTVHRPPPAEVLVRYGFFEASRRGATRTWECRC
jgi:regulator of sigma E protease